MKEESTSSLLNNDLALDEEFDPLEDLEPDEEDAELDSTVGYLGTPDEVQDEKTEHDDRPAEERIEELLDRMTHRRKILLSTIAFCREPQEISKVNDHIDELQADNYSVYSAATLCGLLEKAGALDRIYTDGEPAEELSAEPEVVVVDGVEYLEAKAPVEVFWKASEEGLAIVDADKPLDRLEVLFEEDVRYLPIYKRILTLCSAEGGATTPSINSKVDNDPLVQKPRLYGPHFVDKLEKNDALTWKKVWIITNTGKAALDLLADVDDTENTTAEEA